MGKRIVLAVVALIASAGCGGSEPVQVVVEPAVLTGVVRDSLAQRGLPDMLVELGDSATLTGADGSFTLEVAPGAAGTLRVLSLDPRYSALHRSVTVTGDMSLGNLFPMRNVPFVSDFTVLANGDIEATVSHQAGAAAARRPNSWLVFNHGLAGQSSTYPSTWWNWTQTGPRSWRVSLPLGQAGIQNAFFTLYGPNDVQTVALCTQAGCANDYF